MGILDKLAKKGLSGLKDSLENAIGVDLDRAVSGRTSGAGTQTSARPAERGYAAPRAQQTPQRNLPAFFGELLSSEFPEYEVQTRVGAPALGLNADPCKPYDFILCRDGYVRAAIMLTPHNRDRNAAFLNARAAAQQMGIPFINFYLHYPNERSYVVQRIRSFLG